MYLDNAHCQRAYRKRVKDEANAVGLVVAPSLAAVRAARSTRGGNGEAQTGANAARRTRSGLQLSYWKTRAALIERLGHLPGGARLIDEALEAALPARQRDRLEARR